MEKSALILEGGGMRGVFTSGVLDSFMERNYYFPYVVGVSAGACNAVSYISRQKGRSKKTTIDSLHVPDYMSIRNFIKKRYILNMDLIFDDFPNKLIPFDYDTFFNSSQKCLIGVTNCASGEIEYYNKSQLDSKNLMDICRASSSLPFISPMVSFNDKDYLDGGIANSIPIKKSIQDGNKGNIVILTRNKGYRKKSGKIGLLAKTYYKKHPKLAETITNRYKVYNDTLDYIERLEEKGEIFVIRPDEKLEIKRLEKDTKKLTQLYLEGRNKGHSIFDKMVNWIKATELSEVH